MENQWYAASSSDWLKIIQILGCRRHLKFRRDYYSNNWCIERSSVCFSQYFSSNMARQKPSKSKHQLYTIHSTSTSTIWGPATPAGSEQYSNRNSVAVLKCREDNSWEYISSRGIRSPGVDITSTTVRSAGLWYRLYQPHLLQRELAMKIFLRQSMKHMRRRLPMKQMLMAVAPPHLLLWSSWNNSSPLKGSLIKKTWATAQRAKWAR